MQRNSQTVPKFVISGLSVPVDHDREFRYSLAWYGITVVSRTRARPHQLNYTLALPDGLALWQFIQHHLGRRASDAEVHRFIVHQVRRGDRLNAPDRAAPSPSAH